MPQEQRSAVRLYRFLIVLRDSGSISDTGNGGHQTTVSVRVDEVPWRADRTALVAGLWSAHDSAAAFQCLWPPIQNIRHVRRRFRRVSCSEIGGKTANYC